jgi:hypothetical protein
MRALASAPTPATRGVVHRCARTRAHRARPRASASDPSSSARPPSARYEKTWSNPTGNVLTDVVPGVVWAAERPFTWNAIDVGGKMAVVRLRDGALWVHSPIDLDDATRAAIDALGSVKHVVSPNYEHVKWAAQWKEAYPDATLYGCPGMRAKKPGIPWDAEVGEDGAPEAWGGEFDVALFDCEVNPFTSTPFFNEVVFCHAASGVAFVTDVFWNYPGGDDVPPGTRLWKFGMDRVYLPFYRAAMVRDREKFARAREKVLSWDFDAALPCHGSFIPRGAKDALRRHLAL